MKILIAGFAKIKYMPYINFYLDNIDNDKNEIHVLYWNRDLKQEDIQNYDKIRLIEFKKRQDDDVNKIFKIFNFIKYKAFLEKTIDSEKYDFIIILHTFPGILMLNKLKKYANKYIFDYRDSTYEKKYFFKKIINKIIKYSKFTFVSSDGFRKFFQKKYEPKIFTTHNILIESLIDRNKYKTKIKKEKIRIAYWGIIRNENINKEIINKISHDNRFELHYYGREQQIALNLKEYAKKLNSNNVFFHGEYSPNDRYEFAKNSDIIHNIFCDDNMNLAMSNKYYDGIIFYLPQLCMSGSFMAKQVEKNKIGLSVNPYDNCFTDKIFNYYQNVISNNFYSFCDIELQKILDEYNKNVDIIKDVFNL